MTTVMTTTIAILMGKTNTAIPTTMNTPMATRIPTAMGKIMRAMTIRTNTGTMTMITPAMKKTGMTIPIKVINPANEDRKIIFRTVFKWPHCNA